MTEEDFLRRWSRRKREVAKAEAEPRVDAQSSPAESKPDVTQKGEPEFGVASLPPIESINALTDVTAFLRAGVPAELTRAALRRVWTADPAIRDFVGLAENAWDFTDPTAMPGFGPLESTEDVRRMVAQIIDQIGKATSAAAERERTLSDSNELAGEESADLQRGFAEMSDAPTESSQGALDSKPSLQSNNEDVAVQHDPKEGQPAPVQVTRRAHGGALPR